MEMLELRDYRVFNHLERDSFILFYNNKTSRKQLQHNLRSSHSCTKEKIFFLRSVEQSPSIFFPSIFARPAGEKLFARTGTLATQATSNTV